MPDEKLKDDEIVVKKSSLDEILEKLKSQENTITMLTNVADKGRMARYQDSLGVKLTRQARLRVYKDKLVVGWSNLIDNTVKKENGIWRESQIIEVYTEDGKKYKMLYSDFIEMVKVKCDIVENAVKTLTDEEMKDLSRNREAHFYTLKVVEPGEFEGQEVKVAENFLNS